jgi:hypothetical protein
MYSFKWFELLTFEHNLKQIEYNILIKSNFNFDEHFDSNKLKIITKYLF